MASPAFHGAVVFAGTPEFAVPSLQALLRAGYTIRAVYTQPDRPAGRGLQPHISPVKRQALAARLPIYQPTGLRDPQDQAQLAALQPDVLIVVAYGVILPAAVLAIPRFGCINVHASLLPRWRGAAPIQRAILAGDRTTGVSIMQMDEGLDTGPVFGTQTCPIERGLTSGQLHDRLAALGAQTLVELLPGILAGDVVPQPQDDQHATYAAKLEKAEAVIDWSQPALTIERQVRAFTPWPVAYTHWRGQVLRIWRAQALDATEAPHADRLENSAPDRPGIPGQVIAQTSEGIEVVTGHGVLCLLEVQLAGRKILSAKAFNNAHTLLNDVLGSE